jgi:hypothetical protein
VFVAHLLDPRRAATIVGIVGHVRHADLSGESTKGVYYYLLFQRPTSYMYFEIKIAGDALALTAAIREAVRAC